MQKVRDRGCKEFNLHKFRRTYITTLLRASVDICTVAAYAGHADVKTTMRYLRPIAAKDNRGVINQINWRGGLDVYL